MTPAEELQKRIEDLFGKLKHVLDNAEEKIFDAWYDRLRRGSPALDRDEIRLTRDNFRKAMKQAFTAGINSKEKK